MFNEIISDIERKLMVSKGQKEIIDKNMEELDKEIDSLQKILPDYLPAINFLTAVSKKARDNTIKSIETLATTAIRAVYDEPIDIKLQYRGKNKGDSSDKMEVLAVKTRKNGQQTITGIADSQGGGLSETSSFALRMACIKWLSYKGPIILDEAYKSLSNDEKIERIAISLKEFKEITGNQIVFSTHDREIFGPISDKEIKVTIDDGISLIEEVEEYNEC